MALEKIVHITDAIDLDSVQVQRFSELHSLGLREVVLLHPGNADRLRSQLEDQGLVPKTLLVDSFGIQRILKIATDEGASMISASVDKKIGRRSRKALIKGLLQSSHVPVILMPKSAGETRGDKQTKLFDHVIFGANWSESCRRAMSYLIELKVAIKEIEIIHVVEKKLSVKDLRDLRARLRKWRGAFTERGLDVESHIYAGNRHEEILLAATDYSGTCIVMGGAEKSGLGRLLFPSCPYRVIDASVVPAIVIP